MARARLGCRRQVDRCRRTELFEGKQSGMNQPSSEKLPLVKMMPVFLKRLRCHLPDDRLTTGPRPAAGLLRVWDLRTRGLLAFVTMLTAHSRSLNFAEGRA